MVIVQPAAFFFGEQRGIDQPRVNRAERYRFKIQIFAERGFLRRGHFLVQHQVFDADAPLLRAVQTRLVRSVHAFAHGVVRRGGHLVGNALRAFVHVQEIAHAVTRAVAVIALRRPQRFAADGVQQRRQNAFGEHGGGQRDVRFEHQREIAFLRGGGRANRNHARDVGGAGQILRAGVNQQQALPFDGAAAVFGRAVMRHRAVGVEARNRAEAGRNKVFALAAVLVQARVDVVFGNGFAGRQIAFQLGKKAAQGNAVLHHGLADVFLLGGRFAAFEMRAGVHVFNQAHLFGQVFQRGQGDFGRFEQQRLR